MKLIHLLKNKSFKIPFILALTINFVIEILNRGSLIDAISYVYLNPLVYSYNVLIILSTLLISLLVKRRVFTYTVISTIWLTFGIANGVVLSYRNTPFTVVDISLLPSVLPVISYYLTPTQIVLIIIGAILVLGLFVVLYIYGPKYQEKISYKSNLGALLVYACIFVALTFVNFKVGIITNKFVNIAYAYEDYGFTYCFSTTLLNSGMSKPENYSEEIIADIISKLPNETEPTNKPNIVMLQLESFFDPKLLNNIELSEDPVPNFTRLRELYSTGYLDVPTIGAGTANSEFEILTGMNLDFFGAGEYPYKTILKKTTSESVASNLKSIGYKAHAIHNNETTFYDRHKVFSQLGFDTFTGVEFMNEVELTATEWAKDHVLVDNVISALNSTKGQDFVYIISVQSHGPYPEEATLDNPKIKVKGLENIEAQNSYEYFINQLYEVDQFIGDLITALEAYNEDVVLVMFGDHLPSLNLEDSNLINNSIFKTEYIIWDNIGLTKVDEDIEAYQLTSTVLNYLDINSGTINSYHQTSKSKEDYLINLEQIQYDMLYGKQYQFNGINPYLPSNLQLGVKPIIVNHAYIQDDTLYVAGVNFTKSTQVSINGELHNTTFVNPNLLVLTDYDITTLVPLAEITASQMGYDHTQLTTTTPYIFN